MTSRLPATNYDEPIVEDRQVQRKKEVDDLISKYAKKKDTKDEVRHFNEAGIFHKMAAEHFFLNANAFMSKLFNNVAAQNRFLIH